MNKPIFNFNSYFSEVDQVPVVHIETENLDEDPGGPICRIYLNDEIIWENPVYPGR